MLLTLLATAAIGYGALVATVYVAQRALLYPGAIGGPLPDADWGEPVWVATPDGERLAALHAPAAPGQPTILFLHGNADRIDRYGFFARAFAERGIGLLALSYRGYPGSTGAPGEAGLLADGLAAYDWLDARTDGGIAVLGQSLGSGVGVHVAAERPASALVLVSAYDSVLAVARRVYFFLPVAPLIRDTFRSDLRIARATQPKLFVHGRRDVVIALSHGEALFAAAPEPKRMLVLDGAGHNDIWSNDLVAEIAGFVGGGKAP
ncbi:MAG: alpha/beta hydrolase [Mesorhizobium sp.]|nr:alpha/beta hydrolase [Mesorhizobium sp.]